MNRIRNKALFAGLVSLVGVVGAFAVPGAANAQSGSRLCGQEWQTMAVEGDTLVQETLIKIYETSKRGGNGGLFTFQEICSLAKVGGGSKTNPMDAPDELKNKMRHKKTNDAWPHVFTHHKRECEGFTQTILKRKFEFVGNNFPGPVPHLDDICLDMNRSDSIGEMEAYWLLATQPLNASGQPDGDVRWFLQRG